MARGRCKTHYTEFRESADFQPVRRPTLVERFWRDLDTSGGPDACWLWTGNIEWSGYGSIYVHGGRPRLRKVHRFSYELAYGPIPDGLEIDHTCHTKECPTPGNGDSHRRCCNPTHLEAVDRVTNINRSQAPEKTVEYYEEYRERVTHCPKGHSYADNSQWRRTKGGYLSRRCAECNRVNSRNQKFKRAQARQVRDRAEVAARVMPSGRRDDRRPTTTG